MMSIILYNTILLFKCYSVGIGLCTIVSSRKPDNDTTMKVTPDLEEDSSKILTFATGIFMLTFALFMSARMGIYQEVIYSKYGKHAKEALYYSHCLPLVGFIILYKGIGIWLNLLEICNVCVTVLFYIMC